MLRPTQLLVGALILAACAPSRPQPSQDAERDREMPRQRQEESKEREEAQPPAPSKVDGARYLRGIEQPQVRPLTSIANSEQLASDSVMQHAMISGTGELYVAAAAFVDGEHIGLDLIVVNHREKAIQVHRKDLRLYDASGRPLISENDFPGASELGLRGTGQVDPPSFLYETPDAFSFEQQVLPEPAQGAAKGSRAHARPTRTRPSSSSSWRSVKPGGHDLHAPATLHVAAQSGEAWWAYWKGEGAIAFPITAFVVFGDEQLMFQFEPAASSLAR